ncbi:MAG TPA: M20 family peptidase [Kofleriaceae bacterium]|nr:M20 family peptidase [Kofleriaceae bacterium]
MTATLPPRDGDDRSPEAAAASAAPAAPAAPPRRPRWRRYLGRGLLALAALAVALVGVLLVRAARLSSRQPAPAAVPPLAPPVRPGTELAAHLAGALRLPTVSSHGGPVEPRAFLELHGYLAETFPRVHRELRREVIGGYSLLYTWPGQEPALPAIVLAAHQDVVPAEATAAVPWTHPPFGGAIADGFVWGRGALDDKIAVIAILEAIEHLLGAGFLPRRTIYLAFGHDEEVGGREGAARIAATLQGRGARAALVLDEGMAVTQGIIDGIDRPVALIGVAEKGFADIAVTAQVTGGHSSMPPEATAVGVLARALAAIDRDPMPSELDGVARAMLEHLAPEMGFGRRVLMANLWLLQPLVLRALAGASSSNALIRSTIAPTMLAGSDRSNVLPARARATLNVRLRPGDSIAGVLGHLRRVVDDPRVTIEAEGEVAAASPISPIDDPTFQGVMTTIRELDARIVVAPGLVLGATDAKHYAGLADHIYRFNPMRIGPGDLPRLHGVDERIAVADLPGAVTFYVRLLTRFAR